MKTITINQRFALENKIDNVNQAALYDYLIRYSPLFEGKLLKNEVYFVINKALISKEMSAFKLKPDTIYRHLKKLHKKGLIHYAICGRLNCIKFTEKSKEYFNQLNQL